MGQKQSKYLNAEELDRFVQDTFFTKGEVIKVMDSFEQLTRKKKGANPLNKHLTQQEFMDIPELVHNPFRHRLASVFANEKRQIGFVEFIDFLSVFSQEATREVKIFYAFKMYDFDEDGSIGPEDVENIVNCLVGQELNKAEIAQIVEQTFKESVLNADEEKKLSIVEFEHIISRSPDFVNTFSIRLF
ncbi:hypothetical protein MIR68_011891 [Amoeboaphelidium protococcarum]|nr:hypothetical protein MIR68_011891 [Amoeboaphelidium protococcarum]